MKLFAPLFLVAAMLAGAFFAPAHSAEPAKAAKPDLAKGEASFTAVCAACHGADGNSGTPTFPKLAQQHHDGRRLEWPDGGAYADQENILIELWELIKEEQGLVKRGRNGKQ